MAFQFYKQDEWSKEDCSQYLQAQAEQSGGGGQVLTQVANGCRCRIRRLMAHGAIRQRLLDLGFVPNAEVEMVRCATLGDPLELRLGDRLGDYFVTLRKREADLIEVEVHKG